MTELHRPLALAAALLALSGCASIDSLDRMADQARIRSTCHTSTGELIGGPPCTLTWTISETTSTTTTVVTTTSPPAAAPAATPPTDD
ncbi:hypothetical protein GCM10009116_08300 [Brevundimonas basaltis]|uniref:Lipoprotein n=1 Tax=Brevundimonas basaltis TaxID=472166 RepID=A0A7W8MGH6_9CAUL|nr:hypothetical protein [Brevundimonas basaltis]MBB5292243.1 hypothetical protein [Brevundimonas basaltis]